MSLTFGKIWGITRPIIQNGAFEMHRLEIKAGGKCSKHLHKHKFNLFFIESGSLKIRSWKSDYDLVDETILSPLESFIQKPNEYHEFEALEDTVCFEVYWAHFDHNDIERETVGSI